MVSRPNDLDCWRAVVCHRAFRSEYFVVITRPISVFCIMFETAGTPHYPVWIGSSDFSLLLKPPVFTALCDYSPTEALTNLE